jgi:microcystin degradation protein MlrC
VFIGYRTNPHVDMRERGEEAAHHMRSLLAGLKTHKSFVKLPIQPPTVTMLTSGGPFAEMIAYGQRHLRPPVLNVSVMGGFAWSDTAKNGLCIVVTESGHGRAAHDLSVAIAQVGWDNRARFYPTLTSLEDAVRLAVQVGQNTATRPIILADVADNPGGGGRGNTTFLLRALDEAGAQGVLFGLFNDPPLAEEAHRLGEGAEFLARFNRAESWMYSEPYEAPAQVLRLSDGRCRCRRGIFAGQDFRLGQSAALQVGGITVVVNSLRTQCADPAFFESFGLDIASARTVVVKSRGHFRAGFDEFFGPDQVIEVDLPGLTSPMLWRFDWKRLPRPMIPIDNDAHWEPPGWPPES